MDTQEKDPQEQYAKLLARTALKDRSAFERLYSQTAPSLNAVAMRLLGNRSQAEDVLQESYVQIWHNAGSYASHKGSPLTWMRAIVRYRALDVLNGQTRRAETTLELDPASDHNAVEQTHDQQLLTVCLDTLSSESRQAILSAYLYGYSRVEIAEQHETPINTVKSWLKRGLQRLEQCIRQHAI